VISKTVLRMTLAALSSFILMGCVTKNYGDDKFHLQMASHGKDVMWVPTKVEMAHEMLAIAKGGFLATLFMTLAQAMA
jgi:hypothetical protein